MLSIKCYFQFSLKFEIYDPNLIYRTLIRLKLNLTPPIFSGNRPEEAEDPLCERCQMFLA